jgi:hypothetical protein
MRRNMCRNMSRNFTLPRRIPAPSGFASRAIVGLALAGAIEAIIGARRIFA